MLRDLELISVGGALPAAGGAEMTTALHRRGHGAQWGRTAAAPDGVGSPADQLAEAVAASLRAGRMPLVFAGDGAGAQHGLERALGPDVPVIGLADAQKRANDGAFGLCIAAEFLAGAAAAHLDALRGLATDPACQAMLIGVDAGAAPAIAAVVDALFTPPAADLVALENARGARNYAPLPVLLTRAEACSVWDADGREYLDMVSAYSAASFGHGHPRLVEALANQARRQAVTSRAFHNDMLPAFLRRLTDLTGYARALPVNTGLEAVETALKAARKWGHVVKGIPADSAEIIACDGNFHGRSIAIVGLSSEAQYRSGFGPFPPGLLRIPFGDADALAAAITPRTAAFLVEPIQAEGGIVVPPAGYLAACAEICRRRRVLMICDEVQTGLGRTGRLLACQHDGVRPDAVVLGKALGGGLYPVSAFLAGEEVMGVFGPGDHGSTFGGNALAAAVGLAALDLLVEEQLPQRAAEAGAWFAQRLRAIANPLVREVRGRGLLLGIEVDTDLCHARTVAEALLAAGILTKDTHEKVIRLTPPLTITRAQLAWAADRIEATLDEQWRRGIARRSQRGEEMMA